MDELKQDIRFALRTLAKNRAFTAIAVLTLALGIGANSAIFSVVNGVLLKPLPFPQPEQLLRAYQVEVVDGAPKRGVISPVNLDDWRARRNVIADLAGYLYREGMSGTDLTGLGEPQRLSVAFVSPGFWNTLGVRPLLGRVPRDEEMVRGSNDRLVVLGHAFWQRQFGGEASAIGRRVTLGGDSYEIVGVMPPAFRFPSASVEVFIPYSTIPDDAIPRARPVRVMEIVARMKPGVTVAQANAELAGIARGLAEQYPNDNGRVGRAEAVPLRQAMVGDVRTSLFVLLGAVGVVLLIASVNLASVVLARASVRERELAIRAALGAERSRLIRQLFTESLLLAMAGGVLGVFIAQIGAQLLLQLAAGQLPRADDVGVDATVLAFTAAVAILTGIAFGLVPALRASSPELQQSLRAGARGSTKNTGRVRNVLVVTEVALAVLLVIGAGLMTRSFVKLMQVDLGFAPDHRVALNFSISTSRHSAGEQMRDVYRQMLDRVRAVPGVIAAGAIRDLPFHGDGESVRFRMPGAQSSSDQRIAATLMFTSDGFFEAMGIPLVAGRDVSPQDRGNTPYVFVVNQAFAKRYFPNQNPVGQYLAFDDSSRFPIVGLVGDVRQSAVDEVPAPRVYASVYQIFRVKVNLVARTREDPTLMIKRIQDAIRAVDPQQTFTAAFTLDDAIGEAVARPRLLVVLLGLFGAMGLILGALGIYGVLAQLVAQRTREIGVRVALGAQPSDVMKMIVGNGLGLAGVGVAIGLIAALLLTRVMSSVLYGVTTTDPLTFATVPLVLLGVATFASWVPARRAMKVDPLVALRAE
jgi:predicted permease